MTPTVVIVHEGLNAWYVAVAAPGDEHYEVVPMRFKGLREAAEWVRHLEHLAELEV